MKEAVLAPVAVLALVLTASAPGDDFSQGKGATAAPNWKVLSLGSGNGFMSKPAQAFADGTRTGAGDGRSLRDSVGGYRPQRVGQVAGSISVRLLRRQRRCGSRRELGSISRF